MAETDSTHSLDRSRISWWLFVLVLTAIAAFIAYSFVGMIALGVFGYYATRPINRHVESLVDSESLAAWITVLVVLVPLVVILFYAGFRLFTQAQEVFGDTGVIPSAQSYLGALTGTEGEALASVLENPSQLFMDPQGTVQTVLQTGVEAASAIFGAILLVGLALTLAYFLLENDHELEDGLRRLFGGRDTTAYAYASAVDEDLESVFFGNFLFVLIMAVIATATYWATNLFTPEELHVPMILVLGFLTGVMSLVPIIVGKIVYLPVVGLLALQAVSSEGNQLALVGGVLVVYFLVLDLLPQTFLQPYITGRQLDMIVMMFAYLLGPVLFGWYGFFLLPILFILMLETVRIVLPSLIHGKTVTPDVEMGDDVGTNPRSVLEDVSDQERGSAEEDHSSGGDSTAVDSADGSPTDDSSAGGSPADDDSARNE